MSKEICDCQLSPMDEILKTECDCKETGECDKCGSAYELGSRDGRCGDCGNCGNCCTHKGESERVMNCFSCGSKADHTCAITDRSVCNQCWGDTNETN